jgi:hypothetical protein
METRRLQHSRCQYELGTPALILQRRSDLPGCAPVGQCRSGCRCRRRKQRQDSAGQKVYGMIHCPGNEPSAITVGATNTFGTNSRVDDWRRDVQFARPDAQLWTDVDGVLHYDGLVKPDIVAAGNKIIAAQSPNNALVQQSPQLDANVSHLPTTGSDVPQRYMPWRRPPSPARQPCCCRRIQVSRPIWSRRYSSTRPSRLAWLQHTRARAPAKLNIEGAVRLARMVKTTFGNTKPVGAAFLNTDASTYPPNH